jgi:tRNA(Ile)-lysidine synthase
MAQSLRLDRTGRIDLPTWGGELEISAVTHGGVAASLMAQAMLREREPRDQFQLAARGVARSLKKQYQARAVPAWQRAGPIVVAGDQVIFVPGLGVDARVLAAPGEPQLALRWCPRD